MGYRWDIRLACRQLGRDGRTFDYKDVMREIGDGPDAPTPWQLIRELQHADYLEVAEAGRYRRLTKYRLKQRGNDHGQQ